MRSNKLMANDIKWIKLTVNVFDDEKFDAIKTLPDSNNIQLAWVKLLCLAGKCNESGFLMLTKEIPYTDEMLAQRFNMDIGVVQRAMKVFQQLNMIDVVDNIYMVSNWLKYQSGDRLEEIQQKHRESQRKYREKQKQIALGQKGDITSDITSDVTPSNSLSYSFINHKNIDNYRHLLNTDNYNLKDYILNNNRLYRSIEEWMEYKDERTPKKANHYTEKGMKVLLTEIVKWHKKYGDEAVEGTINHTIANQWQGIVWDWMKKEFSQLSACVEETPQQINADRPERFRTCPDDTWKKLKQFVYDDGSFDWAGFNPLLLNDADRKWMRDNNM